jgi:L-malate glycosyltransferase
LPKICFLADASSPHTLKWVTGCLMLNWEITIISHWPGEIPGAEVIVHPLTLTGFPRYCWNIRRLIRKIKPDIIHAHQFGAHALYAWFAGVSPLVISAWGSDVLVKPKRSPFIRWLVKFLISKAALITSDSAQVTSELIAYGAKPEQILTFLFGIDRRLYEKLARTAKSQECLIICSPRLHEPLYNIKEIIKAFQQVSSEFPKIELWLLGNGSLTAELQQYVAQNQLAAGIRFWGRVSPSDFSQRLAESDLVVSIPSSDGTPVSMLEGMAAGCLPILSDLPVYRDWVNDGINGLIVKRDFTDLAAALRRGIMDQDLRLLAAAINRKLIQERAIWEEQFQPMLEYYRAKVKGG